MHINTGTCKGQKIPMLPSVKPPLPVYIPPPAYPEIPTNDLSTAPELKEDQIESVEMTSMSPNYRTSRLTGLTARFYKHRRSTSLSSYDTRAFMRGRHPTESLDGVKKERSPFHSRSHSKGEPAQVRASLREGTEVRKSEYYFLYLHAKCIHIHIYIHVHENDVGIISCPLQGCQITLCRVLLNS